jgi:hypothetical protein
MRCGANGGPLCIHISDDFYILGRSAAPSSAVAHLVFVRPMRLLRVAVIVFVTCAACWGDAPVEVEELGTFAEFVPASRAKDGRAAFLAIAEESGNEVEPIKTAFVARSAREFISLYRRLPLEVQKKAIWLTVADLSTYSSNERAMLRQLIRRCKRARMSLSLHPDH